MLQWRFRCFDGGTFLSQADLSICSKPSENCRLREFWILAPRSRIQEKGWDDADGPKCVFLFMLKAVSGFCTKGKFLLVGCFSWFHCVEFGVLVHMVYNNLLVSNSRSS